MEEQTTDQGGQGLGGALDLIRRMGEAAQQAADTPAAQVQVPVPVPDVATTVPVVPRPAAEAALQQLLDAAHGPDFLSLLAVFVLAIFVGYYVVWHVTPALHSPLMAVTNAISSVIIVGALIAAGMAVDNVSTVFGFLAVILASVNIFGGFLVTRRMLAMFRKKPR
jgi:NAD(P) transhydrogenase subunit alpha